MLLIRTSSASTPVKLLASDAAKAPETEALVSGFSKAAATLAAFAGDIVKDNVPETTTVAGSGGGSPSQLPPTP